MEARHTQESKVREVCTECGATYAEGVSVCSVDGSELMRVMADPLIGVILPRRYRILSLLGRGAMSVVYKGVYEPLDQLVAIKMLKSHLVSDPQSSKRFQQEAKTAGALNHHNIVGILDFGVTDQAVPYLIMEYLMGQSLAEMIDHQQRISVNRAIRIFGQAADALAYAHRQGVVHRDIKPSNIIILESEDDPDVVKIVDFGIAKLSGAGISGPSLNLTKTGEVMGTPLYMSPEQSMGKELDGRSDIYSLGCVMYESITGQPPFVGDTAIDTIKKQISAAPAPLESVRPDLYIPERLQSVIARTLAKDPRTRYQSMEDLKYDLERVNRRSDTSAQSLPASAGGPASQLSQNPAASSKKDDRDNSVSLKLIASITAGLVLLITFACWIFSATTRPCARIPSSHSPGSKTDSSSTSATPSAASSLPDDKQWRKYVQEAQTLFSAGRYAESEQSYLQALVQLRRFPEPDARVAAVLNELANLYYVLDELDKADSACRESLALRKTIDPKDPAIADNLSNLSLISAALGDWDQAESLGKQGLSIRETTLGPAHHDVAVSLQGLAELECKKGKYKEAEALLKRALSIREKSFGGDHPEVADALHNLAMVNQKQGKFDRAEALYKRALGIRQKELGIEHPSVADTLCALATLNFMRHRDSEAENLFKSALSIRQKAFGNENSRTAEVYSCLAILFDAERKYPQAEECYRQTLQIREKIWGPASPKLVRSLENLAVFLRRHNQKNGAEVYEAQIKSIQSKVGKTS